MRLYRAAGIETKIEGTPETSEILAATAGAFLLAGGVLTLADWQEFDAEERLAFIRARAGFLDDSDNDDGDSAALEAAVEEAVP